MAADMREQHNERGLPHIGGFTAHIRASDHQHTLLVVEAKIIGGERLAE